METATGGRPTLPGSSPFGPPGGRETCARFPDIFLKWVGGGENPALPRARHCRRTKIPGETPGTLSSSITHENQNPPPLRLLGEAAATFTTGATFATGRMCRSCKALARSLAASMHSAAAMKRSPWPSSFRLGIQ